MKATVVVLAAVLLCVNGAHATQYYISPTGNDAGAGTLADPWASPSRGASFRANGTSGIGATTIGARNTQGFLPSGNLNIPGLGMVAYSSKNATGFTLANPLSFAVPNDQVIHDNDILGGVGFQPGDIVTLRGGTYANQTLRLKNSGTNSDPITYNAFPGEVPFLNWVNQSGLRGVVWNDGEGASTKTEFVVVDGLSVRVDQNGTGGGAGLILNGANSMTARNMIIEASGSAGDGSKAVHIVKGTGNSIESSKLRSRFSEAVRGDVSGSNSVNDTIIWDSRIGLSPIGGAVTITADHITFFGGGSSNLWAGSVEGGTLSITNSLISGHPSTNNANRPAFNANPAANASGDYNFFHNLSDNNYYDDPDWVAGLNDTPGANGLPGVDPQFIETIDMSSPDYLRFTFGSPAAFAGLGGTYVGAIPPIPEPASLLVMSLAGVMVLTSRKR